MVTASLHPGNARIAAMLRETAHLLDLQGDNPYRVGAFAKAADTVERLERPLREIFDESGIAGLVALPAIGSGIAAAIAEIIVTGRWTRLDRLRGVHDPLVLFASIPGVGGRLATRIHDTLHVDTLDALEQAAHEGRLTLVPGVGAARAAAIGSALETMLAPRRSAHGDSGRATPPAPGAREKTRAGAVPAFALEPARVDDATLVRHRDDEPDVELLLEIDRAYRDRVAHDSLPKIAPRRFNPQGDAWLPVMHAHRDGWHFTALFSNTEQAHTLGRTHDWVVIYFDDDRHHERQRTAVTEYRGELMGRRVIRGREADCRRLYRRTGALLESQTASSDSGPSTR